MKNIFKRLLNVKGMVVEDVSIDDSPLRDAPVLVARVRCRKAALRCSRCGRKCPKYDDGGGERRWLHQDFGCYRVRARGSGSACGMPCAWRGGVAGSVGGAGHPVHARLRDGMHVADDGRQQEDRERFPACRVEDRGRHRRTGRRPAGIRHAMHVRRAHGDRRGRDQPQEGPHVHHRRRRPRTQAGDLGARRIRQTGPRPVLRRIDAGAARLHQDRHRRRRQVDRLVRRRILPERGARARLIPHRLLDDRLPGPGQETVVEPGQASEGQDGRGGDEGPEIRRAQKPRRLDRAPIHGPRHARRRGSQGPALPLLAAQGTPAHAPAPARRPSRGGGGKKLKQWINWASHSRIPEIVELCRKIRRRRDDILRTIRPGHSNARLEAFNNRIKVTIRMAYGFHHVDNLIAMIKLKCSGLPIRLPVPVL